MSAILNEDGFSTSAAALEGEMQKPARGKTADRVVECLRSAVTDGTAGLADVPQLVERVIREDLWRVRETKLEDSPRKFATFAEFVQAAPPAGLGTNLNTLLRLCDDAPTASDLIISQTPVKKRGGDRRSQQFRTAKNEFAAAQAFVENFAQSATKHFKSENLTFENDKSTEQKQHPQSKRRNSRQYSLTRLRNKRPELYEQVLRGEISAHEAMITAGLRREQISVSATDPVAVATVLIKKYDRSALIKITDLLQDFLQT